jgi:hypothetical protein
MGTASCCSLMHVPSNEARKCAMRWKCRFELPALSQQCSWQSRQRGSCSLGVGRECSCVCVCINGRGPQTRKAMVT